MHRILCSFVVFSFISLFCTRGLGQSGVRPIIESQNDRFTYIRGEIAPILIRVKGNDKVVAGNKLIFNIDGLIHEEINLADNIQIDQSFSHLFKVDTNLLKTGQYNLVCSLQDGNEILATAEYPFFVARRWNPDRMRMWLWPHQKFGNRVYKLDNQAKDVLGWYADKGFNSFNPGGGNKVPQEPYISMNADKFRLYDYALANGWEISFTAWHGFYVDVNVPDATFEASRPWGISRLTNPFHPTVALRQNELNEAIMRKVSQFPQVTMCFVEGEIEDSLPGDIPMSRNCCEKSPMAMPHTFIAPGVIDDNDEDYLKRLYRYEWGDGLAVSSRRIAEMAHKYRSDIKVFSDPLRKTTVYNRFNGMDMVSTWTYTNPDPKLMLYVETLIANAKPYGQGIMPTVTLLNYPGTVAPKDKGWIIMGPDRLVETSWINLSRNPEGMSYYIGSGIDPFDPGYPEGTGGVHNPAQLGYPYQLYPETFEALKKFANDVVKPYGPMIRKLESSPRRVAVLSSEASRVYSASPKLVGNYDNYQVYSFYTLLSMIHIPADIVFDQTIVDYGLDQYDMLVLPKCDTLTKSVYEKICAFKARGGVVVCDQYLRAQIPGVVRFDFDFTYRGKVSANALLEKKDYMDKTDNETRAVSLADVNGITAMDDQKKMESYASMLRAGLEGRFVREADCFSSTVLLNMLRKDGVEYLFVINDKRTYDERFGEYKAILEKGLAQNVTITLNSLRRYDNLCLYDVLDKKELAYSYKSGACTFDVNLPPAGGKIIAIMSYGPESLEIVVPEKMPTRGTSYRINVLVRYEDETLAGGVEPLKIHITDPKGGVSEYSDYYAAQLGKCSLDFVPAVNDAAGKWLIEVTDLMTGRSVKKSFEVR